MGLYKITWKRSAQKELRKLPKAVIQHIVRAVEQLHEHPYPVGVKKLAGTEHTYRFMRCPS
jgi:mRNA interferase RelE/StbE